MSDDDYQAGLGLDIGTMNLVSARKKGSSVQTKRMRDAFYEVPQENKEMLNLSDTSYVEHNGSIYVLGDQGMKMANVFGDEARRPLSQGLISPDEQDGREILGILIDNIVGSPQEDGEVCCFSSPGNPIDMDGQDTVYHESVFKSILSDLGYEPHAANEAMGIIYSECADTNFTGIGISFGSGMVNLALSYNTMSPLQFSVARGGDWIDQNAARAMGSTASKMCQMKEDGIDLMDSGGDNHREAIIAYYKALMEYALDAIADQFRQKEDTMNLPDEFPIVLSGGTSLATNFKPLFEEVFESKSANFPLDISEIRMADDPMTAVAEGLLIKAMRMSG
jgi:hypothetical protein